MISRGQAKAFVPVLPALAIFVSLFVAPFAFFFAISFYQSTVFGVTSAFTLENYAGVAKSYWSVILATFAIGLTVATLATSIAFSLAHVVRFSAGRYGPILLFIVMSTMFGGYLIKVYAWKTILGNEGILNSSLLWLGIIDKPLSPFFSITRDRWLSSCCIS